MAQVKERGGGGEERKETLADKPLDFENRPLGLSCLSSCTDIKFWHQILMLSSAVIIHWPIKCLAFRGAEMNFRGRVCETKIINVIFCILDCVDGANGEISINPNDQCRLCSFVLLIRLKGTTTRVKFWSFSSKLPESWIWRVKCDKHSSEVFSIRDAYLYKFKAQLDRMSYSTRHSTEN